MNTPNWVEYCTPTIWFVLSFSYYNYDCFLECKIAFFYFSICLQGTRMRHSIHIAELLQRSISTLFCPCRFCVWQPIANLKHTYYYNIKSSNTDVKQRNKLVALDFVHCFPKKLWIGFYMKCYYIRLFNYLA